MNDRGNLKEKTGTSITKTIREYRKFKSVLIAHILFS